MNATTTLSGPSLSSVIRPVVDGPEYPGSWTADASVTVTLGGLTVLHCSHFPVTVSSIGATVIPGGAAPTTVPASVESPRIHAANLGTNECQLSEVSQAAGGEPAWLSSANPSARAPVIDTCSTCDAITATRH